MNNPVYKKGLAVVLIIALLLMTAIGIKLSGKEEDLNLTSISTNEAVKEANSINVFIYVDIDGAVNKPGVYQLKGGDRVNDAINLAGGLKEDAYTKNLNKARALVDGEKIYILSKNELEDNTNINNLSTNSLVNINTATNSDLMSLPGIGEVYAKRIIEYRSTKAFSSIEEIKNIEGIGDKTFNKIKDLITIGQ